MRRMRAPRWLRRGAGLVAALLVLEYLVLPQIAGARHALHLLTGVQPAYLGLAVALEAASLVTYAALTRVVIPRETRPSLWTALRIDLTTLGVSHVLPGGAAAAGALRFRLLTGAGIRRSDSVLAATVQGVGSAVVLNVMLLAGLVATLALHGSNPLYGVAAGLGLLLLLATAAVVLALTWGREGSVRYVRAVFARVPRADADTGERVVRRFAEQLRLLGSDRTRLTAAVGWATANWVLDAASLWVFVLAFGHRLGPAGLLVPFGLANVLAVLPVTPGGLGIVEGILVPTLVGFGTPRGVAILAVVSYRLVSFWLPIPLSAATYVSLRARPLRSAAGQAERPWQVAERVGLDEPTGPGESTSATGPAARPISAGRPPPPP
ncbi:MAG: YbhN family protein [Frankiaceae bacterium]